MAKSQFNLNFESEANNLIIFDEADRFILEDTTKFAADKQSNVYMRHCNFCLW